MAQRHRHRVHISVTQADIDAAMRNESKHCAVATGISSSLEGIKHPQVDIQTIRFSDPSTERRYIYLTPPVVAEYIIAFDAGDPIEPFEFDLVTPAYVGKMRRNLNVKDSGPRYNAIVNAPRDTNGQFAPSSSSDVAVPVRRSDVPRLIADREYGRRKLRANQDKGGRVDGGLPHEAV